MKFIDSRLEEIEAVKKYNILKIEAKNICDLIIDYIEGNKIINEPHVLLRISKKLMYDENDKVLDIFKYYYDNLLEEENDIVEEAKKDLSYEDYLIFSDHGKEDLHSDLIDGIEEWKSYLDDLKVILECIEVEIELNSQDE